MTGKELCWIFKTVTPSSCDSNTGKAVQTWATPAPSRSPMVSVFPVRENGGFFRGKIPCKLEMERKNASEPEPPFPSWSAGAANIPVTNHATITMPCKRQPVLTNRFPDSIETETIEADGPCLYNALIKATDISEIKFLSNQLQL